MKFKNDVASCLVGDIVKKYQRLNLFQKKIAPSIKKVLQVKKQNLNRRALRKRSEFLRLEIKKFCEENIVIDPSKKNCKKVSKENYVSKRYLQASKLDLHIKFCEESSTKVSYTTFLKYCPEYCVAPSINVRDTCACPIHVNFAFLINSLHKVNVLSETSSHQFVKNICCEKITVKCLTRNCFDCKHKTTFFNCVENADHDIVYKKWITITEKRKSAVVEGKDIKVTFVKQEDFAAKISDVIKILKQETKEFLDHESRILHQFNVIKTLKESFETSDNKCLFLRNFSENYACKYKVEIQGIAFWSFSTASFSAHWIFAFQRN